MGTWKKIAIIVGVVIIVSVVILWVSGNWMDGVVNPALCTIQNNIGLRHHFHIGNTFQCTPLDTIH